MQKIKDKNINFRMNKLFSLQSAIGSQQFEDQNIYFFADCGLWTARPDDSGRTG
jgi:hypothetical protein